MNTFGERLRKLRENKELTQIELAKVLSLANSTISQYEANRRSPDSDTLQRLADFFGVTVDYLLCRPALIKEPPSRYHIDNEGNVHDLEEMLKHAKLINIDGKKYTKEQLLSFIRIGVVTSDAVDKIKWPEKN